RISALSSFMSCLPSVLVGVVFRRGLGDQVLTSRKSRRPSPKRLNPRTVTMIASPEKIDIHGAESMYCLPSVIIEPHVGVGGATPNPRNDSEASTRMAVPVPRLASTIKGETTLGSTCPPSIRSVEEPRAVAAC